MFNLIPLSKMSNRLPRLLLFRRWWDITSNNRHCPTDLLQQNLVTDLRFLFDPKSVKL
jgi:hypothetical protein